MASSPGPVLEDSAGQSVTAGIPRWDAASETSSGVPTQRQHVLHCPSHSSHNVSWKKRHVPHLPTPCPVCVRGCLHTRPHGERGKGKMNLETRWDFTHTETSTLIALQAKASISSQPNRAISENPPWRPNYGWPNCGLRVPEERTQKDRQRLLARAYCDRTRGNDFQLIESKLDQILGINSLLQGWWCMGTGCPEKL